MQKSEFFTKAGQIINAIATIIEEKDMEGEIDVDLNEGILNLSTDKGVFVISRHSAAQEVWLSSPVSGPYHFARDKDIWVSKSGVELLSLLEKELHIDFSINLTK